MIEADVSEGRETVEIQRKETETEREARAEWEGGQGLL